MDRDVINITTIILQEMNYGAELALKFTLFFRFLWWVTVLYSCKLNRTQQYQQYRVFQKELYNFESL